MTNDEMVKLMHIAYTQKVYGDELISSYGPPPAGERDDVVEVPVELGDVILAADFGFQVTWVDDDWVALDKATEEVFDPYDDEPEPVEDEEEPEPVEDEEEPEPVDDDEDLDE